MLFRSMTTNENSHLRKIGRFQTNFHTDQHCVSTFSTDNDAFEEQEKGIAAVATTSAFIGMDNRYSLMIDSGCSHHTACSIFRPNVSLV